MPRWSYQQLSTNVTPHRLFRQFGKSRRITIIWAFVALSIISIGSMLFEWYRRSIYAATPPTPHEAEILALGPPAYTAIRRYEKNLPQHNLELPFPEGRTGRYVKFSNQLKEMGWNNCFNELLMNAHLAYMSKRAYVFQDFVWIKKHYPWPTGLFSASPRTPLNALIAGPTAGGPWEVNDDAPRSISEDWFDVVCPVNERRIINTREVKPGLSSWLPGDQVFEHWRKLLHDAPERCIEIQPDPKDAYPQIFDLWQWGPGNILPLWDSFLVSPTSRLLKTSPLVDSAVRENSHLFTLDSSSTTSVAWDRVMAMHIRRGDYSAACHKFAKYNSTYYGWNQLALLPDKFVPPPGGSPGQNTPENIQIYLDHCFPTLQGIVEKVRSSRADYIAASGKQRELDVMYVLTNDHTEFMDKLKEALRNDGWKKVTTTQALVLNQEQTDVSMSVDMDIARQAGVFIGNGWSSFTSNIVHQRLRDGKEANSIRLF